MKLTIHQETLKSFIPMRSFPYRFLTFAIVLFACVLCGCLKSGFFVDEIYTYGLANSHFDPFMRKEGSLIDKVIEKQTFLDYVTVKANERFDFASVYYNQTQDNHPPLHYWMINGISSFFPDTFTKWQGLALNFVLFALTLFLLYGLVLEFTNSDANALSAVVLFGLSQIGLSTFLMIRMYMLLTFFTILLTYQIASILKRPKWYSFLGVGLTIFAGLMSQYLFFFYAFFLCSACGILLLVRKEYKNLVSLLACSLVGVVAMCLAFPACFDHLFADKLVSGSVAKDNVLTISNYVSRFFAYGRDISHGIPIATLLGIVLFGILAWDCRLTWELLKNKKWQDVLVVAFPCLATLFVAAITSPVCAPRYIYNLVPMFVFIVVFMLTIMEQLVEKLVGNRKWINPRHAIPLLGVLTIVMTFAKPPDFLYLERKELDARLEKYAGSPCVLVDTSNILFNGAPRIRILANIPQLMRFKDVFITNNPDSNKLNQYLGTQASEPTVVLFVESYLQKKDDYQQAASAVLENTGYAHSEFFGNLNSSKIYILTKDN